MDSREVWPLTSKNSGDFRWSKAEQNSENSGGDS